MAFGAAAMYAAAESNSVQDFCEQGNWETVASTVGGAALGGYTSYTTTSGSVPTGTSNSINSRGSTGKTEPVNLREQLAMEQVQSNPLAGKPLPQIQMNDPRWPASEGWIKMQQIVPTIQGEINIHYVYNQPLKIFDDFKFNP